MAFHAELDQDMKEEILDPLLPIVPCGGGEEKPDSFWAGTAFAVTSKSLLDFNGDGFD